MTKIKNYPNFQVKEIYEDEKLDKIEIYSGKTGQSLKLSVNEAKELKDILKDF